MNSNFVDYIARPPEKARQRNPRPSFLWPRPLLLCPRKGKSIATRAWAGGSGGNWSVRSGRGDARHRGDAGDQRCSLSARAGGCSGPGRTSPRPRSPHPHVPTRASGCGPEPARGDAAGRRGRARCIVRLSARAGGCPTLRAPGGYASAPARGICGASRRRRPRPDPFRPRPEKISAPPGGCGDRVLLPGVERREFGNPARDATKGLRQPGIPPCPPHPRRPVRDVFSLALRAVFV